MIYPHLNSDSDIFQENDQQQIMKSLEIIIKRAAEEKLLPKIQKKLEQKDNQKNQSKTTYDNNIQNLIKARNIYKNPNFNKIESDLYIDKQQLFQEKLNKFLTGQDPLQYFQIVHNKGSSIQVPNFEIQQDKVQDKKSILLAQNMFKKKVLLSELYENQLEKQHNITRNDQKIKPYSIFNKKSPDLTSLALHIPHKHRNKSEFQVYLNNTNNNQNNESDNSQKTKQKLNITFEKPNKYHNQNFKHDHKQNLNTSNSPMFITHNQSNNTSTQHDLYTEDREVSIGTIENNKIYSYQSRRDSKNNIEIANLVQFVQQSQVKDISPFQKQLRITEIDKFQQILTEQYDPENDQQFQNLRSNNESPVQKKLNNINSNVQQRQRRATKNSLDFSNHDTHRRRGAGLNQIFQIHLDRNDQNLNKHFHNISQNSLSPDGVPVITYDNLLYYLKLRYGEKTAVKIITFMDVPAELDFRNFRVFIENLNNWQYVDILFFCFYLMDLDEDGILNSNDIFQWLAQTNIQMLESDFIFIARQLEQWFQEKTFAGEYSKPVYWDFYIGEEPKTHKKFVKKSRFIESGLNQSIKKNSLYHLSILRLDHDYLTRERKQNYEIANENSEKQNTTNNNTNNNKEKLNQYFSQNKRLIQINFELFKEIFQKEKPLLFYDLIAYLTLQDFRQIKYPYNPKDFLNIFKKIQEQMQCQTAFYKEKEALAQLFPYSYKDKAQGTIEMVKLVKKYKQSGQQGILSVWKKEQEKFAQELEQKNLIFNSFKKQKTPTKLKLQKTQQTSKE